MVKETASKLCLRRVEGSAQKAMVETQHASQAQGIGAKFAARINSLADAAAVLESWRVAPELVVAGEVAQQAAAGLYQAAGAVATDLRANMFNANAGAMKMELLLTLARCLAVQAALTHPAAIVIREVNVFKVLVVAAGKVHMAGGISLELRRAGAGGYQGTRAVLAELNKKVRAFEKALRKPGQVSDAKLADAASNVVSSGQTFLQGAPGVDRKEWATAVSSFAVAACGRAKPSSLASWRP